MRRFLFIEEQYLLFGLVQHVIKTQELLEGVLQRGLLAFRNYYLERDRRVVKEIVALVLELRSKVVNQLVFPGELLVEFKVIYQTSRLGRCHLATRKVGEVGLLSP